MLRHDVVGGDRGDVAAGRRQALDHHNQRLLRLQPDQRVVELFRAGRGSARGIDVNDDCRGMGVLELLQRLDAILITADQTFDIDACDRAGGGEGAAPARRHRDADDGYCSNREDCGQYAPERQLAANPAAIDDHV